MHGEHVGSTGGPCAVSVGVHGKYPSNSLTAGSKTDKPVASHHVLDATLDGRKAGAATSLALEMIDDSSQRREFFVATATGTVVQLLLICRWAETALVSKVAETSPARFRAQGEITHGPAN